MPALKAVQIFACVRKKRNLWNIHVCLESTIKFCQPGIQRLIKFFMLKEIRTFEIFRFSLNYKKLSIKWRIFEIYIFDTIWKLSNYWNILKLIQNEYSHFTMKRSLSFSNVHFFQDKTEKYLDSPIGALFFGYTIQMYIYSAHF